MMTDVEELLREGIDRFTAGASVPADLTARARASNRRRRIALGTTATGGIAVVAAAAVLVATAGTGPSGRVGPVQAQTAAYVVARTGRAMAAAQGGNAVEQVSTTGRSWGAGTAFTFPAAQVMSWYYRGQGRWTGRTAGGSPVFDENETMTRSAAGGQRWAGSLVDYREKTWWNASLGRKPDDGLGDPATPSCSSFAPDPFATGPSEAAEIRAAQACGQFTTDGTQRVDGVNAIKLVSTRLTDPDLVGLHYTLWVDPATYLPVRTRWTWKAEPRQQGIIQSDIRWLPASSANQAALTVPVPAGFREVPPPPARQLHLQNAFVPDFAAGSYTP